MLEQLISLTDKILIRSVVWVCVLLCVGQFACHSDQTRLAEGSPSPSRMIGERNVETNQQASPTPLNRLSQGDLTDVAKLIERFEKASETEKKEADFVFSEAKKLFEKGNYTLAGQGFGESAILAPTVDALVMYAKSLAKLNVTDHPKEDRLDYKLGNFKDAIKVFETVKIFADKTSQTEKLKQLTNTDEKLGCMKSFLGNRKPNCDFVKEILNQNEINY